MTNEPSTGTALVRQVTTMASQLPASPRELVERIRALREVTHVLSPAVTAASIPEHIKINTVVEVIDVGFDAKSGRGNDVYFQASIHKSSRNGRGDEATFVPLEVSLNATAIKRVMAAAGVSVTHSDEIPTGNQNHWKWQSKGRIRDFDGSWRELPPGTAEIDLRDGSAQIGEWTPEKWAERLAEAAKKAATLSDRDKWKAKPQPINGWTAERVISARRFGLRLAEAKSLNALGRNFGLKQVYSIEELLKPFVIFRATFNPDMSDPAIKQMVTAAEMGATNLLYPGVNPTAVPALPPATVAAAAEPLDGAVVDAADTSVKTGPALKEVPFEEEETPSQTPGVEVSHVTRSEGTDDFFIELKDGRKLHTNDRDVAKACNDARKAGQPIRLVIEKTEIAEIEGAAGAGY